MKKTGMIAALSLLLEQLKQNPPKDPVRPPYPIRVRN